MRTRENELNLLLEVLKEGGLAGGRAMESPRALIHGRIGIGLDFKKIVRWEQKDQGTKKKKKKKKEHSRISWNYKVNIMKNDGENSDNTIHRYEVYEKLFLKKQKYRCRKKKCVR